MNHLNDFFSVSNLTCELYPLNILYNLYGGSSTIIYWLLLILSTRRSNHKFLTIVTKKLQEEGFGVPLVYHDQKKSGETIEETQETSKEMKISTGTESEETLGGRVK